LYKQESLRQALTSRVSSAEPIWRRMLALVVAALAVGSMVLFCVIAFRRVGYPFELEWIEGSAMDQIVRVKNGQSLYGEPSIYSISLVYNPVYYIIAAQLMKLFGVSFAVARLISIAATLGCFGLLFLIVSQRAGHPLPGLIAAGIYAATFRFAGAWMDLVKTDSLSLFLLLLAFFVSFRYRGYSAMIVSGLLYVLAYYTKQNILPIALMIAPFSLLESRGRTWPIWATVLLLGPLIFWYLDITSAGWYSFFTFDLIPYNHKTEDAWYFWRTLAQHLWPALLIGIGFTGLILASMFRPALRDRSGRPWSYMIVAAALILSCWSVFRQRWVYDNGFLPACIGAGMLAGLAYGYVARIQPHAATPIAAVLTRAAVLLLVLWQFAILAYDPTAQVPTEGDRAAGEQFIKRLKALPGEVLVFDHGFMNSLAGKTAYMHSTAYADASGSASYPPRPSDTDNRWRREKVRQIFDQAIQQQYFDWIIVDNAEIGLAPYYIAADTIFDDKNVFYTSTGARTRPQILLIKNPVVRGGELDLSDTTFNALFEKGWSVAEDWGRWAVGQHAALRVLLEPEHAYKLTIEAMPFCYPRFQGQSVQIGWNDHSLRTYKFHSCDPQPLSVDISADQVASAQNTLWFAFERATAPRDVGMGADGRYLAAGFRTLSVTQQNQR
jgi:Dolichyl-phosphate-mannose-protein mannosyltransferase